MKFARFVSLFSTLLTIVLAAAVAEATTTLTFTSAGSYDSLGTGADNVLLADLNGDGNLDMVICNTGGYTVYLGNGDGTFNTATATTYPTQGTGANLIALADLNGDGFLDILATTNYNDTFTGGGVDVLLGNGDGTFQQAVSYSAGPIETVGIAVGDVNGDGIPDVVVTSDCQLDTCLTGNVTLLLGRPKGALEAAPIYLASTTGGPIALANLGNGNLDIVFSGGVLLGDGSGDFEPVTGGEIVGGATSIAIADVNGDGIPDVVETTDVNQVDVLLGNGDGTLQQSVNYKSGGYWPLSVTIADINNDGHPDLIVGNECQFQEKGSGRGRCNTIGYVSVLTNKGGPATPFGGFNAAKSWASGGYQASSVAVGATTGNRKPDLVISNLCQSDLTNNTCVTDGSVTVLLNNSMFSTSTTLASSPDPSYVNQPVLLTATVSSPSGSAISNSAMVTFTDGTTTLGTGTVTNGVATLTTSFPRAATASIKATFAGDSWNNTSFGTTSQTVSLYTSTVTSVSASPNPAQYKEAITLSATVTSAAPGGPTGTVQFKTGNLILGNGTLSGGSTTITTLKYAPVGSDTITATYEGDTENTKSTGTTVLTVTQ